MKSPDGDIQGPFGWNLIEVVLRLCGRTRLAPRRGIVRLQMGGFLVGCNCFLILLQTTIGSAETVPGIGKISDLIS